MTGLLGDNYRLMQLLGGIGLLGSKRGSQADRYMKIATQGLLGRGEAERQAAKDKTAADLAAAQMAYYQSKANAAPERKIMEDPNGVNRYVDTGEPVFPGVEPNKSPFKDTKESMDMQIKIGEQYDKKTKPEQKRIGSFDTATQVIRTRGGFEDMTGADDTLFMKAFANMLLPNEAVMSDDLRIIAQQSGIPGELKNMMQRITGGGQLKPEERARIYQTMNDMFHASMRKSEQTKADLYPKIQQGRFNYNDVLPRANYPIAVDIPRGLLEIAPKGVTTNNNEKRDPARADSILNGWRLW